MRAISDVKFRQDAAVSAYLKVYWINDNGKTESKDLGPWKPINTEEQFNLLNEGVPNGVMVRSLFLSLCVWDRS
jgi:hypothetical protein